MKCLIFHAKKNGDHSVCASNLNYGFFSGGGGEKSEDHARHNEEEG